MPISSSEIAQLNGAFTQQSYNWGQYSQAIGQQGSVYGGGYQGSGSGADRMMGGMMNTASAVGSPLMSGAMGLLGLDPMSIGLKAGMGAFAGGAGFGGAAVAGGMAALPLMAAGAAVKYTGQQMYAGAEQQQALNQTLRSSFNFRNQHGGQGFERSEMSNIGSMMRGMSEQFGPGGEITSFRELTGLAGKMGSMGFAQGVRDVQDFSKRFKEMVTTLKGMAKDLGSTLEEAMEFAQSAKGSGVFGSRGMAGFTGAARAASVSGGLALSEVTGAASIGSQISRSIGGLGRQGAMAGIKTMSQIGNAQQMGILSEEDIYNVTGLTGAEGRQAYAASSLQSSAKFLSGSRGRRLLASMASNNGTLDEGAVHQLLAGNMGIAETMQNDASHLSSVGRANFIRNEGRLRGAALERLGGFLPALQLSEWAQSKGIDVNDMDDRSMLFAQRQLGMGRDEIDQAVKMANAMPQIMEREKRSAQSDQYFQALNTARKGQGVEGIKQRFDQAKELINGKLQKVGQDLYNSGSEQIESFFNDLFGTYVKTYAADIDDRYREMRAGGPMGKAAGQRAFGIGGGGLNKAANKAAGTGGVGGTSGEGLMAALNRGSAGGLGDSLSSDMSGLGGYLITGDARNLSGQVMKYFTQGESGVSQLRKAGFEFGGMNDAQARAKLSSIESMQRAALTGASGVETGKGAGTFIRDAYAMGRVSEQGDARVDQLTALIEKQAGGDPSDPNTKIAQMMKAKLATVSGADKLQVLAGYERMQGVKGEGGLGARYGLPEGGMAAVLAKQRKGGFGSVGEEDEAFAAAMGITAESKMSGGQKFVSKAVQFESGQIVSGLLGPLSYAPMLLGKEDVGTRVGNAASKMYQGTAVDTAGIRAAGSFIKSAKGRDLVSNLLNESQSISSKSRSDLMEELASVSGTADEHSPTNEMKRSMAAASEYAEIMSKDTPASDEEQRALASKYGMNLDQIKGTLGAMGNVLKASQNRDIAEEARRVRDVAGKERGRLETMGVMQSSGELTASKRTELKKLGANAEAYAERSLYMAKLESEYQGDDNDASVAADRESFGNVSKAASERANVAAHMSALEKEQVAKAIGDDSLMASAAFEKRFQRKARGGSMAGMVSATADVLGVKLDKKEMMGLDLTTEEGAGMLLGRAGISDKELRAQIMSDARSKDTGALASHLEGAARKKEDEAAEKQKEADYKPVTGAIEKSTSAIVNAIQGISKPGDAEAKK